MSLAAISLVVTPEGPNTDINHIKQELQKEFSPKDIKEESIGFGLRVLRVMLIADDKKGLGTDTDKIEAEIRKIKGVADVRTEDVTLL